MFILAQILITNYIPEEIEDEMVVKKMLDCIQLDVVENYKGSIDEFLHNYGYPVKIGVISADGKHLLANEDQLGWITFDDEEVEEIDIDDINILFEHYSGWVEIEIEDFDSDDIEAISSPIQLKLHEGLCVLKTPKDEHFEIL
jgi:hypothetical protein